MAGVTVHADPPRHTPTTLFSVDGRPGREGRVSPAPVALDVVHQQLHLLNLAYLGGDDLVRQLPHPGVADVGLSRVVDGD